MTNQHLNYFWVDMSIYPGNSGGPVIVDDKLVGIVSAQPTLNAEKSQLRFRVPFGKIIHAEHLFPLLELQELKDKFIDSKAYLDLTKAAVAQDYTLESLRQWAADLNETGI